MASSPIPARGSPTGQTGLYEAASPPTVQKGGPTARGWSATVASPGRSSQITMYVTRGSGSSNDRIGIPLPEQRPSDTDPSKPATKPLGGWAALDGLSDSTKTVITTTLKFGLAALVLSYVIPLAYALIIGRCPEGETYVLTRGDDSTINPNWATQWSSVMSTEVTRHCVPRTPCHAGKKRPHKQMLTTTAARACSPGRPCGHADT